MSVESETDVKKALVRLGSAGVLMQWEVKYETGFKTFLNALDYSAVFLMAYQDHLPWKIRWRLSRPPQSR